MTLSDASALHSYVYEYLLQSAADARALDGCAVLALTMRVEFDAAISLTSEREKQPSNPRLHRSMR
jgi:hypothetical protein